MLIEISPLASEIPNGPLIGTGIIKCEYDEKELDIQVSILPIHPATARDLEKYKGKQLTVSIPELTLQNLQTFGESERDKMRFTEQYAAVCRKLGYEILAFMQKHEISVDYALTIDHAGQLMTMFIAKIADIETYEIRRIKKARDDGETDLTVLLPQNLYPMDGKKILLLDEFVNTGFTLREVIKTIKRAGGQVILIGAFKILEGGAKLLEKDFSDIPIVTLE